MMFNRASPFVVTFFCLDTKEPTKSSISDRLRAAFSPAHLGDALASLLRRLSFRQIIFFIKFC